MAAADRIQDAIEAIVARSAELAEVPDVVRDGAWQLALRPSDAVAELAALRAQRSVWALLALIAEEPEGHATTLSKTESHRVLLEEIVQNSHDLQRAQTLAVWSEDEHQRRYAREGFSVPMDWGVPYAQTLAMASEQPLDPDCVSRSAAHLHPEDAKSEARFWRGAWQLLLAGRLSQGDDNAHLPSVLQLCQAFGHDWRAVSISGGLPYHVAGDAVEGNVHRWLWRYTCRQMANSDGASVWERAAYALLSGDVANMYPVCETWQEFVWATCAGYVVVRQDELLHDHLRGNLDERCSEPLDDESVVSRIPDLAIRSVIDRAESAYFAARPEIRKDSYHRLVKYLALDDVQEVFDELYETMISPEEESARFCHRPAYIEFAFRLYMALNPDPEQDEGNARIVVEYIRYLSTTHDLQHLIPEAISALPDTLKVTEYASVLRACMNASTRTWFLEQASARFSPDIIAQIHQRLLTLMTPIGDVDLIDDLVECQSLDPTTALKQANAFFREFIARNRFDDAIRLYESFQMPPPSDDYDDEERELLCWSAFIKARVKLSELESWLTKRPRTSPAGIDDDVETRLNDLQFGSAADHLRAWESARDKFFEVLRRAVMNVVRFEGGWMRFDEDEERDGILGEARRKCLPDLVVRLFGVCEAMPAEQAAVRLDVVVAVAEAKYRAFQAFDQDALNYLLTQARHAYLAYAATLS